MSAEHCGLAIGDCAHVSPPGNIRPQNLPLSATSKLLGKNLFPAFSGFPRCSSGPLEKGEKGRNVGKKADVGRSPGREARHPLRPHLRETTRCYLGTQGTSIFLPRCRPGRPVTRVIAQSSLYTHTLKFRGRRFTQCPKTPCFIVFFEGHPMNFGGRMFTP